MSKLWIMSFLSLLICGQSLAQEKVSLEEKQMRLSLDLAESLFVEGKKREAFYLYQDFIEMYPDSSLSINALERMAQIYSEKQRFSAASKIYHRLYTRLGQSEKGLKFRLRQATLLEQMGQATTAAMIYEEIIKERPTSVLAEEAAIRLSLTKVFLGS